MQSKIVFREMLSELKALADVQGNYLTKEDIKKFFPGDALNEEQFGLVCEYLVSQKIKVDGYEPAQKTPETAQKTVKDRTGKVRISLVCIWRNLQRSKNFPRRKKNVYFLRR